MLSFCGVSLSWKNSHNLSFLQNSFMSFLSSGIFPFGVGVNFGPYWSNFICESESFFVEMLIIFGSGLDSWLCSDSEIFVSGLKKKFDDCDWCCYLSAVFYFLISLEWHYWDVELFYSKGGCYEVRYEERGRLCVYGLLLFGLDTLRNLWFGTLILFCRGRDEILEDGFPFLTASA